MKAFEALGPESETHIEAARAFALKAHGTQTLKNGDPYSDHLDEVADLVRQASGSESCIIAALLHDTVENTDATVEVIRQEFGDDVATMVAGLTDDPSWKGLPALKRKTLQATHMHGQPDSVHLVKLADQTSRMRMCAKKDHVGWENARDRHDYIEGSRRVAWTCRGVSNVLDELFEQAYRQAYETHF